MEGDPYIITGLCNIPPRDDLTEQWLDLTCRWIITTISVLETSTETLGHYMMCIE